jgi:surface polysaccharide O-acyltransferase-like enzyme
VPANFHLRPLTVDSRYLLWLLLLCLRVLYTPGTNGDVTSFFRDFEIVILVVHTFLAFLFYEITGLFELTSHAQTTQKGKDSDHPSGE